MIRALIVIAAIAGCAVDPAPSDETTCDPSAWKRDGVLPVACDRACTSEPTYTGPTCSGSMGQVCAQTFVSDGIAGCCKPMGSVTQGLTIRWIECEAGL
jgi:hypothetical protein